MSTAQEMTHYRWLILCFGFTLACATELTDGLPQTPPVSPPPAPPKQPPPMVDETEKYFDLSRVLKVEIQLAPEDFETLRNQTRDFVDIFQGEDCMDQPFAKIFTYFPAEVRIDDQLISQVGVRKKGFIGSLSDRRPSLKLNFDEYVEGQRFSGFERMTLNNVQQDQSGIGQCLAYWFYAKAGLITPRCSFAHVYVNGQDLGIYSHVDSIKKRFLSRYFDDNDGTLWEGTLSDFREGWLKTFEQKTDREMMASSAQLEALATALTADDADLFDAIEPYIDLDSFLTFWATESLVWHWDGYAGNRNNFYLYEDPSSNKFAFIPWGVDTAFKGNHPFREQMGPRSVLGQGYLSYRLYNHPEGRRLYLDRLERILNDVWNENELLTQISNMETLVRNSVIRQNFDDGIDGIREFVRKRRAILQTDIDLGGVDWKPQLVETYCREARGRVQGNFSTTWGTHPTPNAFMTGSGTMSLQFEEHDLPNMMAGASAGMGEDADADKALLLSVGYGPGGSGFPILVILAPPERIKSGEVLEIDRQTILGHYLYKPAQGEVIYVGQLSGGSVTLEQAGTNTGNAIVARYELEIF